MDMKTPVKGESMYIPRGTQYLTSWTVELGWKTRRTARDLSTRYQSEDSENVYLLYGSTELPRVLIVRKTELRRIGIL